MVLKVKVISLKLKLCIWTYVPVFSLCILFISSTSTVTSFKFLPTERITSPLSLRLPSHYSPLHRFLSSPLMSNSFWVRAAWFCQIAESWFSHYQLGCLLDSFDCIWDKLFSTFLSHLLPSLTHFIPLLVFCYSALCRGNVTLSLVEGETKGNVALGPVTPHAPVAYLRLLFTSN